MIMLTQSLRVTLGLLRPESSQLVLVAGIKYFPPPKNYDHATNSEIWIKDKKTIHVAVNKSNETLYFHSEITNLPWNFVTDVDILTSVDIDIPERQRLRIYDKVPTYPSNLKPPKMQKRLRYMRGPEPLHTNLQLQQYGVVATGGGRMRSEHFEMARLVVARKLDQKRMFAIWRVDPPWQPVTKKGQGQRMGGGKGAIDHYVTPIKAGRIILEVGGKCDYAEVYPMLKIVAERLPFKAEAVSLDILKKKAEQEKWLEDNNQNYYTMKYIIQNNMGGCHRMLSPFDHRWYGKYL